jgi:CRISPR system Cascade subunit CasE
MYLSRIEMDTRRRETMRALSSPHVLHAAVENCFFDESDNAKPGNAGRNLWRTDRLRDKLYLLLLSPQIPDFAPFARQFCDDGRQGETKPYDGFLGRIKEEQRWRFRLRANPVHSVPNEKDEAGTSARGKVYAHVTPRQQKAWLAEKAPRCGFALDEEMYEVVQSEQIRFRREGKYVTLGIAAFEGTLQVKDLTLFTRSLTEGIGRAKAYGCGLLTIAGLQ